MSNALRKHLKQLPYFLLYNYPKKLKTYNAIKEKNKSIANKEDKLKLNAYHSPSPMNELCDYICTWEKKNVMWSGNTDDLVDSRCLIINNDIDLSDRKILRACKKCANEYVTELKAHLDQFRNNPSKKNDFDFSILTEKYKAKLIEQLGIDEEVIANYVIKACYSSLTASKSFAWSAYGDYIIKNLKANTHPQRNVSIREVPYKTNGSYEFLGKHYVMEVGDTHYRY